MTQMDVGKESISNAGAPGLIPGSGRSPGEGIGCPPQYSWASLCGSAGRESACNVGDLGSVLGLGRSPGGGKGYPLQYSGLEDSMACIVHGVAKSRTRLSLPQSRNRPADTENGLVVIKERGLGGRGELRVWD